jgi:glycine betaine/proline transport system ATP-binding protein
MKTLLTLKNVCKVFGESPKKALKLLDKGLSKDEIFEKTGNTLGVVNASFDINEGEIFVIMGLSGSGKSTLVRLFNRLIEPSRGELVLEGQDIAKASKSELRKIRREKMSMVFQSFALMPHMSVIENTAFGLELSGVSKEERNQRALDALSQVGLEAWADSYPSELSGGMQQRVGLARALANDPKILLMDEAFSALDPLIRTEMQDELLKLQQKHKRTIVFISHDLDEAMRIGDRIAIMHDGRVVQVGAPEEILKNPADDYVSSFFRGVDVSTVLSAGDIASKKQTTVIRREGTGIETAIIQLQETDREHGYLVNNDLTYIGIVTIDSLKDARKLGESIEKAIIQGIEPIQTDQPLNELLGVVADAPYGPPIIDNDRVFKGALTRASLLRILDSES